jgi:hypothetical protein
MDSSCEWLLTAPWEPVFVRRGDPLGFRALSNRFADMLAPDLSNQTQDARWLTILSWCLCVSERAPWRRAVEGDSPRWIRSREGARARYEWLRPLELLWVARTFSLLGGAIAGRQLPGIRAIKQWDYQDTRFGFSNDQWQRYRQTGVYGAYRVMFRRLAGLTRGGDGWSPDKESQRLAEMLEQILGKRELLPEIVSEKTISHKALPETYWKNVWTTWRSQNSSAATDFLPTSRSTIQPLKYTKEREILSRLIFSDTNRGQRRSKVAIIASKSTAVNHAALCEEIASHLVQDQNQTIQVALLPAFTRFADAALNSLVSIWACFFQKEAREPVVSMIDVSRNARIAVSLGDLRDQATTWLKSRKIYEVMALPTREVDSLAHDVVSLQGRSRTETIACLVRHHLSCGGGLRWMKLQDSTIVPTAPTRHVDASQYRFRLWQVCRMAVQCGVVESMPAALTAETALDDEEEEAKL